MDEAWARAFYATAVPFNVIGNEWFKPTHLLTQRFVKQQQPGVVYQLPPRQSLATALLDKEEKRVEPILRDRLFSTTSSEETMTNDGTGEKVAIDGLTVTAGVTCPDVHS